VTVTYVDAAECFRNWLRDHATDLVVDADRINYGVAPGDASQISVWRVGGGDDVSDAPLDRATLQFDVWHGTSYNTAKNVKNRLRALLRELRPQELDSNGFGYGAEVQTEIFLDDRESSIVHFALTVNVVIRAIT
jgi:hypothetical protein